MSTGRRLDLGTYLNATPGALRVLLSHGVDPITLLARHQRGDWGDLDDEDKGANDRSVLDGSRILSAYKVGPVEDQEKVWVITEALMEDGRRYGTTILLPSEY